MKKFLFYLLSFTWGLPMTLVGCVVSFILLSLGYKPKKYGGVLKTPHHIYIIQSLSL
jgi:hypothetical protein